MQRGVGEDLCVAVLVALREGFEVAAVEVLVGRVGGRVLLLRGGEHGRGGVEAEDVFAFLGELGGEDAVAAAEVEDCVGGVRGEEGGEAGGEEGDEGRGEGVAGGGPVVGFWCGGGGHCCDVYVCVCGERERER